MAARTPAVGDGRGSTSPTAGHQPITEFVFETPPGQDEVRARLAALEAAKHATHTAADPFCPLCPTVRCSTCHDNGGWQQPDGLIIECPRGCMTDDGEPDGCTECGRETSRPGMCFDCAVESSYVGGLAPRFGAQP